MALNFLIERRRQGGTGGGDSCSNGDPIAAETADPEHGDMYYGYNNNEERDELEKFTDLCSNTLLFVESHWNSLLMTDFPSIPKAHFKVQSLQLLALTNRK